MILLAVIFIALVIGVFAACIKYGVKAIKMSKTAAENGNIGAAIVIAIFALSFLLFPVFIIVTS